METNNADGVPSADEGNSSPLELSIIESSGNVQDETVNYQTADEEGSSKYFSMIDGDSTLGGSAKVESYQDNVSMSNSKSQNLPNSLSSVSVAAVNKLHIHERIDAANILSGGVDIFDDCENSVDEHDLVIDDDPHPDKSDERTDSVHDASELIADSIQKEKEILVEAPTDGPTPPLLTPSEMLQQEDGTVTGEAPPKESVEDAEEVDAKPDNYSALLQGNLPEGSSRVMLLIDEKNVEAVHIGEGVYIYKNNDGDLTAMQITLNEDDHPNIKYLHVGKNEDGNLEVYEEQVNQVAVTNEELESLKSKELLAENAEKITAPEDILLSTTNDKIAISETVPTISLSDDKNSALADIIATHSQENQINDTKPNETSTSEILPQQSDDTVVSITKELDLNESIVNVDDNKHEISQPLVEEEASIEDVHSQQEIVLKHSIQIEDNVKYIENKTIIESPKVDCLNVSTIELFDCNEETGTPDVVKHLKELVKAGDDTSIELGNSQVVDVPVTADQTELATCASNETTQSTHPLNVEHKNVSEDIIQSQVEKCSSEIPERSNTGADMNIPTLVKVQSLNDEVAIDKSDSVSKCSDVLKTMQNKDEMYLSDVKVDKNDLINDEVCHDDREILETYEVKEKIHHDQISTDMCENVVCLTANELHADEVSQPSVLNPTDVSETAIVGSLPIDCGKMSITEETLDMITSETPKILNINTIKVENFSKAQDDIPLLSCNLEKTTVFNIAVDVHPGKHENISQSESIEISQNDPEDNFDESKSKMESQSSMESDDDPDEDDLVRGEPVTGDCDAAWPGPDSGDESVCPPDLAIDEKSDSISLDLPQAPENVFAKSSVTVNHMALSKNTNIELKPLDSIEIPKNNDQTLESSPVKMPDSAEIFNEFPKTFLIEESKSLEVETCDKNKSTNVEKEILSSEHALSIDDKQQSVSPKSVSLMSDENEYVSPKPVPFSIKEQETACSETSLLTSDQHESVSSKSQLTSNKLDSVSPKSVLSSLEKNDNVSPKALLLSDESELVSSKSMLVLSGKHESVSTKPMLPIKDTLEGVSSKSMLLPSNKHELISSKPILPMCDKHESISSKSMSPISDIRKLVSPKLPMIDKHESFPAKSTVLMNKEHKSVSPKSMLSMNERVSPKSMLLKSDKPEITDIKKYSQCALITNDKQESISLNANDKDKSISPKCNLKISKHENISKSISLIHDQQQTTILDMNTGIGGVDILKNKIETVSSSDNCLNVMKNVENQKRRIMSSYDNSEIQISSEANRDCMKYSRNPNKQKGPDDKSSSSVPVRPLNVQRHYDSMRTIGETIKLPEKMPHSILENNNESSSKTCNRDSLKNLSRKNDSMITERKIDKPEKPVLLFEDCVDSVSEQNKNEEILSHVAIAKIPHQIATSIPPDCLPIPRVSPKNNQKITDPAIPVPQIGVSPNDRAVHPYSSSSNAKSGSARTYLQNCRNTEIKKIFNNDHSTPISNKYDYGLTKFGKPHPQNLKLSTLWSNQQSANRPVIRDNRPPHPPPAPLKTYSTMSGKIISMPDKKRDVIVPSRSTKDESTESTAPVNKPVHQSSVFSGIKRLPSYGSPLKSNPAVVTPKEDENVIGIQQYIGTASDANVDSDVVIYSAEDTASSADESINSEHTTKSKSRQPRKQVFTPVTRSDMEIIFPNLYTAEKEASKQTKPARLPYKPRGRPSNADTPKIQKKETPKDKAAPCIDLAVSPKDNVLVKEKNTTKEVDDPKHSDVKIISNSTKEMIENLPEEKTNENTSCEKKTIIDKSITDDLDLNNSTVSKENLTQNINLSKEAQILESKGSMTPVNSDKRDDNSVEPPSSSAKRKRGRPKKIPAIGIRPADASPTVLDLPTAILNSESDQKIEDLRSDESASDKGSPRINSISPFGKINETIVCPICFKTFRTENVLLKHVKHCNGAIDKEALKSPKRRKMLFEETSESPETVLTLPLLNTCSEQILTSDRLQMGQSPEVTTKTESKTIENKERKSENMEAEHIPIEKLKSKSPISLETIKNEHRSVNEDVQIEDLSVRKALDVIVIDDSISITEEPKPLSIVEEVKPIDHKAVPPHERHIEIKNIAEISEKPVDGTMKTKANSKSYDCVPLPEKIDHDIERIPKINTSCLSRLPREKMVGGGRKNKDVSTSSVLSPMSRLSKILNTKPPARDSISCEICGKTFRQLAHMVYHRDKHDSDEVALMGEKLKTKPKTDPEPIESEVVHGDASSQKGPRKVLNLSERSGDVKSRRTSSASVKSEPEAGFRCDACDKSFRKLHHLVEHRELHAATALARSPEPAVRSEVPDDATCTGCGKSFRKRHHMVEHRDVHCSPGKKGRGEDETDVRLSVASSASDESNSCGICGKSYRKLHHMVEHRESHTERADFINTKDIIHECAKCYMVFPNENSLNKHAAVCLRKRIISRIKSANPDIPEETPISDSTTRTSVVSHSPEPVKAVAIHDELPPVQIIPEAKLPNSDTKKVVEEPKKKPLVKNRTVRAPPPLPPKKRPKRLSEPKITEEDDTSKYKINEDSEIKYKINPAFDKSAERSTRSSGPKTPVTKPKTKRLSEPLPKLSRPSGIKPAIVKPKNKRVSGSALAGLRVPSSKMLETIFEECSVRYSFPPVTPKAKVKDVRIDKILTKDKDKKASTKTAAISPKVRPKQAAKVSTKSTPSNKTSATLVVNKRKSIGGRKSIDGKKLPTSAKKLQLKCCKQIFNSQATLAEHRKTHKARQNHKCDCGKTFDSEVSLKRHIDTEHTPPKSFKCTECGTSVRTASQFQKHKKEHESTQKTAIQRKAAGKVTNLPKKATAAAKTPEQGAKKAVKRKLAHGGVPLSDKMKKAMAGGKF